MSANVDVVKRIYALAFANFGKEPQPDFEAAMWDLFDPDVVVRERADFPDAATYHGHAGLTRWWRGFFEVYDDILLEPKQFTEVGGRIVVDVRQRLRSKAGATVEQDGVHVWTLLDGRVIHITGYRGDAFAALGLPDET